jgi:nicotinic acid mononucleotide adenylyltransferase
LIDTCKQCDISSTKVKENINKNEKINKLITEKIEEYIIKNKLYK